MSCGTGVTAVALAMNYIGETEKNHITLQTEGGDLQVAFEKTDSNYQNIWLIGHCLIFRFHKKILCGVNLSN